LPEKGEFGVAVNDLGRHFFSSHPIASRPLYGGKTSERAAQSRNSTAVLNPSFEAFPFQPA
jgi:hypothetical protein